MNNDLLNINVSDLNKQDSAIDTAKASGSVFDFSGLRNIVKNLFSGKGKSSSVKSNAEKIGSKAFKYENPVLEKYYKNLDEQEKNMAEDRMVDTDNLMSERFYFKDSGPGNQSYSIKGHKKETAGFDQLFTHKQMEKAGEKMGGDDVGIADIPSTAIHRVRYNPKTKNLYVTFTSGDKEYLFPNVPEDTVRKFLNSSSKGRNYHLRITPYRVSKEQAMAIKARDKNK